MYQLLISQKSRNGALLLTLPLRKKGRRGGCAPSQSLQMRWRVWGPSFLIGRLLPRGPDAHGPGLLRAGPSGKEQFTPSSHSACLSSVPSGDWSANSATHGASGRGGLWRVYLSASARKRSGPEGLATPNKVSKTARSAIPCRSSASGHRAGSSIHTRGQSRETGSLSTFSGSVEASAKCISMGLAHCRAGLGNVGPGVPLSCRV